MAKNPSQERPTQAQTPRTIVYQNADFVSAMLQEMYQAGLLQSAESDTAGKKTTTGNKQKKASAGAGAEGSAPLLAKATGRLDGEWVRQQTEADERSSAQRQKFVYSQAHYLDAVRRGLAERGQLSTDAFAASAGDIAEFTAVTVRPNEVNALLDIATPTLVREVTRFAIRHSKRAEIQEAFDQAEAAGVDIDAGKIAAQRAIHELTASDAATVAEAIAEALHVDARRTATREYHATVTDDRNAVLICDAAHFVTADPDRLLDGQFTVLGKVIKPLTPSTPILANNKLLRRFQPEAVADLLGTFGADEAAAEYFDLSFDTEITNAITVMPIAIYI
ncbi:hypothetical protein [Tsukamurella pseudospumae]|uniref:Uncharacterized protein n=1 Tax=Tsukamurella pseudospumae TaxID=239498 RepID=A0A137ZDC8_9ACTN|nr:hypothetical protein [Tsukamurella pseudospumae]KXO96202.1 hypothetical protein AXK61_23150 [Tsukamurella pseudospumae]